MGGRYIRNSLGFLFIIFFVISDDVLKRNVYLDRYALRRQSGGSRGGITDSSLGKNHSYVFFLFLVRNDS